MTRRQSSEELVRSVSSGTAADVGEDYFRSLVRQLASVLGVRYCFLTECLPADPDRLSTLAFWQGEAYMDNFEYDSKGTPCELVTAGQSCVFNRGIQALFPDDQDLVDLEAESYAAVPFQDSSGEVIGHLAILDCQEFEDDSIDLSVLKIFAARAGAELERRRAMAAYQASEDELRRQQQELERRVRERTEELEAFIHTVSHDLRSPLLTIGGFAHILRGEFADGLGAKGVGYLERIIGASRTMGVLLDHLLTLNRLNGPELELAPVKLRDIVQEAVQQLDAEIQSSEVELAVELEDEQVSGNTAMLTHTFSNLISNAVKYSIDGQPQVRIWARERDSKVRAFVQDRGIGITPDDQQRIFRPFERGAEVESTVAGTGLGLAIVAKAIERMSGRCGVESTPGEGSTFWIELASADWVSSSSPRSA